MTGEGQTQVPLFPETSIQLYRSKQPSPELQLLTELTGTRVIASPVRSVRHLSLYPSRAVTYRSNAAGYQAAAGVALSAQCRAGWGY